MLPREHRLTERRDFAAVYARKKSWADNRLVLYVRRYKPEESETPRFGFSVSKKVGKAHVRNKVKRRLRHICRACQKLWAIGFDVIFVARGAAAEATFADMDISVRNLMRRAGILVQPPTPPVGLTEGEG